METIKKILKSTLLVFISLIIGIVFCEFILRAKHHFVINYDIEMWKYAKQLKVKVDNKKINHVHVKNKSAILQKTEISINNFGQRDIYYEKNFIEKHDRSFLILGSSVALGWGVDSKDTFTNVLNRKSKRNKQNWLFINGGIGNYNTERYINNFFENWKELGFTDIIVHFFVNDTELINAANTNIFTENLHLGVVIWKLINSYIAAFNPENIKDYYKERFDNDYKGYIIAQKELEKLSLYCKKHKIRCHLVVMPDLHKLNPYKLNFINKEVKKISIDYDFNYFDLLPIFQKIEAKKLWNKYNDPHPNSFAHDLMGNAIYDFLNK